MAASVSDGKIIMSYRAWLGLLLVVPFLGVAACTPESRNTLPAENRVALDGRLIGHWRDESDSDDFRIEVSQRDARDYAVVTSETIGSGAEKRLHKVEYRLQAFELGGKSILAVQELGRDPAWRFLTYRWGGDDEITLFTMDETPIRQLIDSGQLAGTVKDAATSFVEIMITAPAAQLAALVGGADAARLFTYQIGPFQRQALESLTDPD